ncbi:MAG: circadian clock protein KaiC [Actinomycetota bacterium]|jgi:circadian clock protein KaiC|nr:circadian clock protein KaiC [Actinomycetota bacterium]
MTRMSSGDVDLDLVLGGGLEPGATIVFAGSPGTGKTTLAQQICFANATEQRKAVYYTTLSEPHDKLVAHLEQFSFFDPAALGPKVEYLHLGDLLRGDGEGGVEPMVSEVVRKALDDEPAIMVIDSAKLLRDLVDEQALRAALYDMTSRVSHAGTVLLLLGEYTTDEIESGAEFSLADGIIQMSYESREPVDRRWLRVVKMRGGSHLEGQHALRIGSDGVQIFPRIETLDAFSIAPVAGRVSSGVPGLDPLMGGGIPAGDVTLVLGPSGAGKTLLCLGHLVEGLARGDDCLFVSFQDAADQLLRMAAGVGWDLQAALDDERLTIVHVPIGRLDLDMLASMIRRRLAERPAGRVVIDSLAELLSASREVERLPAYLRSLTALIRSDGSSLFVTSETTTMGPPSRETFGDLMFLFQNVIQLRYIERASRLGRALNVLKMRNSGHDTGLYLCEIGDGGLTVGERLIDVTGALGWSALNSPVDA